MGDGQRHRRQLHIGDDGALRLGEPDPDRRIAELPGQAAGAELAIEMERHVGGIEMAAERLREHAPPGRRERRAVRGDGIAIEDAHSASRMMMSSSAWLPTMKA